MSTKTAPPCTIVAFGATGELTKRLLMPAIYNLAGSKLLDDKLQIKGLDHNDRTTDSGRTELNDALRSFTKNAGAEFHPDHIDQATWGWIARRLEYTVFDFENAADYVKLKERLTGNIIFYLAVAPRFFGTIAEQLGKAGLLAESDGAFRRLVIEKPFGSDLRSAQALNARMLKVASEKQLYRVDHFLGKEPVQGIMPLRFDNGIFEPMWTREHIDSVQITAAEMLGVEERGKFYEVTGALRDMIPNHLFSVLTMTAMEAPGSYDAEAVRDEKVKLLDASRPIAPEDAARGQYGAGAIDGKAVKAYHDEDDVAAESRTETFKAKEPGPSLSTANVRTRFAYKDFFEEPPAVGYETLLYHAMTGNPLLFQREDMVDASWAAVQPVLDAWGSAHDEMPPYRPGSDGPDTAAALLERDGRRWLPMQ